MPSSLAIFGDRRLVSSLVLVLVGLPLIAVSVAATSASAAGGGSISGTVTDAVTKLPIKGLEVCANPENGTLGGCARTGADGDYTIADLHADSYAVYFVGEPLGYEQQEYHGELGRPASFVEVGTGSVTGIDFEMHPWGRIEGTVRKRANGNPVEGIRVCAFKVGNALDYSCDRSAADGTYQLKGVTPGEYVIEFLTNWTTVSTQFYPAKDFGAEAEALDVELSQVLTGIDAELNPASRLEGTVRRATGGATIPGLEVCAGSVSWGPLCTHSTADGAYALVALPPGQYLVEFVPHGAGLLAQFWDDQEESKAAELIFVEDGSVLTGIDADIKEAAPPAGIGGDSSEGPTAPRIETSPFGTTAFGSPTSAGALPPPTIARRHCAKGLRRVTGKAGKRCVRRHRRHAHSDGAPIRSS
jgi:Carboxypeptidase regulatory-like domain